MGKVDLVGIERAVAESTGIDADSDLHGKLVSAYNTLKVKGCRGTEKLSTVIRNDVLLCMYVSRNYVCLFVMNASWDNTSYCEGKETNTSRRDNMVAEWHQGFLE